MRTRLPILLIFLFVTALSGAAGQQTAPRTSTPRNTPNAENMQRKLEYIEQNSERTPPNSTPTIVTEAEVNSWFASSYARLPKGVHALNVIGEVGKVVANARVDFDEIKGGRSGSMNPLMALFGGVHDVQVVASAQCEQGEATVHVQSVSIDGTEIPRMALQFFADRYLTPKYPGIGLDSTFRPGYRIDSVAVGRHQMTIVQK